MIKLMMPDSSGEFSSNFMLAVVETKLQQKLCASDFIARIIAWGTFDGAGVRTIPPTLDKIEADIECPVPRYRLFFVGLDGVL